MREEIVQLLRSQPFIPFVIHANDGRTFEIRHVDFCMLTRRAAYIYHTVGDEEEVVRLPYSAITSLDSKEPAA